MIIYAMKTYGSLDSLHTTEAGAIQAAKEFCKAEYVAPEDWEEYCSIEEMELKGPTQDWRSAVQ
jgi:hypothetical protein